MRFEGKQVNVEVAQSNAVIQEKLKATCGEITQLNAKVLTTATILTSSEVLQLEQKEVLSPEDSKAIATISATFMALMPVPSPWR